MIRRRRRKRANTPLGLPRVFFVGYYAAVLCITGNAISAAEPFKGLLERAGVCSHLSNDEMRLKWADITNVGVAVSIMGCIGVGALADIAGPKLTALAGQLMFASGYALIFFSQVNAVLTHYAGACLLGLAFSAIFVSHTCVAALYPVNTPLILAIIGSAPDISLLVPNLIDRVSASVGIHRAVSWYLCLVSVIFVLEAFLVPFRSFEVPVVDDDDDQECDQQQVDNNNNNHHHEGDARDAICTIVADRGFPLKDPSTTTTAFLGYTAMPLWKQLATPHFWVLALFTGLNMFRKAHYMQLVAPIMEDIGVASGTPPDRVNLYLWVFNRTLWMAIFPALGMGALTNSYGVVAGVLMQNIWGTLLYLCCTLPFMQLQWASIVLYSFMSSYIFGIVFASLATYYGLRTLTTLQGIQLFIAGLFSLSFNLWNHFVVAKLPSVRYANVTLLGVSIALFCVPLYLWLRPASEPRGENVPLIITTRASESDLSTAHRRASTAYATAAAMYDGSSLRAVRRTVDIRCSKDNQRLQVPPPRRHTQRHQLHP